MPDRSRHRISSPGGGGSSRPDAYTIINTSITQPVEHARPAGPTFTQQVDILIPAKAAKNAPVFFNLGNEHDLTDRDIIALYTAYGAPENVIFIQAEHRGYGQSVTAEADSRFPPM